VITATPDLANLRNAKNVIDLLKQSRTNDGPPRLIVNMAGMPKRQEIPVKEFCQHLELQPTAIIEFDTETYSAASANGRMIEEMNKKAKSAPTFRSIAMALTNRQDHSAPAKKSSGSALAPLLSKLKLSRK
jgi:pilus assembly protein CpaE